MSPAPIKVLLVEDSPSDAELLQSALGQTGAGRFQFTWVERLDAAFERLSRESFDVLLLDLSLPDSFGPDTFRRARKAAPDLPIVVLTGTADESLGLAAVQEGVQDYLLKSQADGRRIARVIRYAIERQQTETQLLHARNEWERTFDSVPDLIAILDKEHRIVRANRAMAQRLAVGPSECAGQQCFQCVHGTDRPPDFCPHVRTLQDGQEHIAEVHEQRLGGDFLVSTTPFLDGHGQMVGAVHVARDITELKRAEARIRQQNAALAGINSIFHAGLTCDTEEQLGRACLAVTGQVTGSRLGFIGEINGQGLLDAIAVSDTGWEACRMRSVERSQAPGGFAIQGIYGRVVLDGKGLFTNQPESHPDSIGTPEGHPRLTSFLGVPLKQDGRTIGIVAAANREGGYRPQDLEVLEALAPAILQVLMCNRAERAVRAAEERRIRERMADMQAANLELARANKAKSQFVSYISHELRTPMNAIVGLSELLAEESDGKLDDASRRLVGHIREGARDLMRLLNDMLDLSRIEAGRVELHREEMLAGEVITEVLELFEPLAALKGVRVDVNVEGDYRVYADRIRLKQILCNLLHNAVKFTPSGGRVWVEASKEGDSSSTLSVCDSGPGVAAEEQGAIFEAFYQSKTTSESGQPGTGLGLAITKQLVEQHGGRIRVSSELGKGSRFVVVLPAIDATSKAQGS